MAVQAPGTGGTDRGVPPRGTGGVLATAGLVFAAVMMIVNGALGVLQGAAAIARDSVYATGVRYVYTFDVAAWGWIHVALGAALALVGFCLLAGAAWARWAGVLVASVSLALQFMFLPYYPLWAVVVIALDVFVIWALLTERGGSTR